MPRAKKTPEIASDPMAVMLARLGALRHPRSARQSARRGGAREPVGARDASLLCEREIERKDHRRIVPEARLRHEMALKLAHFPAVKELAGFNFEAQPSMFRVAFHSPR